jgi:hypothetical protein
LQELLPFFWQAGELSCRLIEANMSKVDGIERLADFRLFRRLKEIYTTENNGASEGDLGTRESIDRYQGRR